MASTFISKISSCRMKVFCKWLMLGLIIIHGPILFGQASKHATPTQLNQMTELEFVSAATYSDPFNDVELDVVFKRPDGKELKVPAFWKGGNRWAVRYSSGIKGIHRFNTICTNTSDAGLHQQKGTLSFVAYRGSNPLYKHGAIKVADDKRHFAYADGTPFFWMGDTWWMGLSNRISVDEMGVLADNRLNKGYNVIQIVAGLYPDMPAFDKRGANEAGFPWDTAYKRINPAYFDSADKRINFLVEKGLVPCIVGGWGFHLPWLGTANIKKHWRNLIARWGALPVVWCAAGETTMPYYLTKDWPGDELLQKNEWTKVIQYMRETDGFHRMITTHPSETARASLTNPEVLDFDMHQSGHGSDPVTQSKLALRGWNTKPVMPVTSGESEYEALEIPLPLPAAVSRKSFWANAINAGFAGHTYGANGIWQINRKDQIYGNSPGGNNWGITPWDVAMMLPGSGQIGKGSTFIKSLPGWNHLEPHPEMIVSWSRKDSALCASSLNKSIVVYLLAPGTVSVKPSNHRLTYNVSWFDPVAGKIVSSMKLSSNDQGIITVESPKEEQDWVLSLITATK